MERSDVGLIPRRGGDPDALLDRRRRRPGSGSPPTSRAAWTRFAAAACACGGTSTSGSASWRPRPEAAGPGACGSGAIQTEAGSYSTLEAGTGPPILMLHGLGGNKASFLPTVAALAPSFRTIAVDMLGFGDSDKPLGASYGPEFQARGDRAPARRARARAGALHRAQHGRPRGARARASATRSGRTGSC